MFVHYLRQTAALTPSKMKQTIWQHVSSMRLGGYLTYKQVLAVIAVSKLADNGRKYQAVSKAMCLAVLKVLLHL